MKTKRLACLFAAILTAGWTAACGNKVDNSDKTLEIAFLDAGYGYSFIERMGEKFEAAHPGVNVVLSKSSDIAPSELLVSVPGGNTVDLFISGVYFDGFAARGPNMLKGYDCILEPIDDVLETEIDGKKIFDRFEDGYAPHKVGEHYYSFSWARGMTGLVYNKTVFDEKGYKVPNTTKEMEKLCAQIRGDGQIPFVFSARTGYWSYLRNIWYMQYQGVQGMYDLLAGIDNGAYSRDVLLQKGRLVSLETLDSFINTEKGNNHGSVNSLTFTQSQARFISGDGLMMVNGDWLENEMKKVSGENARNYRFEMLKTPVVSEIIDWCSTVNSDETLSKVIAYIDGNAEKAEIEGVSDKDIERIREARRCRYTIGLNHTVGIPVYATAKSLAKEFLKYMATDEAQAIYMRETSGNLMSFKYDMDAHPETWNAMSAYSQSVYSLSENAIYYGGDENRLSGFGVWNGERENPEMLFTAKNDADRKTPKQIFDEEYEFWTPDKWNRMLAAAGVI